MGAQEHSKKFAHIKFPEEIDMVAPTAHNAFAKGYHAVYRINTTDWTIETVADLSSKSPFTAVQALTARGEDVYWYVYGEGIYHMKWDGKVPKLVLSKGEVPSAHQEEDYSSMNIDPTGNYLVLYGWRENAAVFDIHNGMKPVVAFNDYTRDAYWIDGRLWTGCIDNKVVINSRKDKSRNNQDFIGDDQTGMIKIYVNNPKVLPNMGEVEQSLDESGELVRFIYNKGNGDLLMCISDRDATKIYKINSNPEVVAQVAGEYHDFTALSNKIFARQSYEFVEIPYGSTKATELQPQKIKTDILKPKLWPEQKPDPYEISGCNFMDYDEKGNLWIITGNWGFKELFVIFNGTQI